MQYLLITLYRKHNMGNLYSLHIFASLHGTQKNTESEVLIVLFRAHFAKEPFFFKFEFLFALPKRRGYHSYKKDHAGYCNFHNCMYCFGDQDSFNFTPKYLGPCPPSCFRI
jgi:hypothetical protein